MKTTIKISVELTEDQAWYLAQFVKRASLSVCEHLSDPTNSEEPSHMMAALNQVRRALAEEGYAPR